MGPGSADETQGHSAGPPRNWVRRAVIAAVVALVLLPLLGAMVPLEVARWHQARAMELELDDDYSGAVAAMDRALEWAESTPELWAYRGWLKLKVPDLNGALADANQAEALRVDTVEALLCRIQANQRLGNHDAALGDANRLVQLAVNALGRSSRVAPSPMLDYATALNQRAYVRALAGKEIDAGLVDIEEAIERDGTKTNYSFLDTRGYLRFLAGDLSGAEQDMAVAVTLAEEDWEQFQKRPADPDGRVRRQQERQFLETLAVLYQHRGLVAEKLARPDDAAADFERAKKFGYNPAAGVW